MPRFKLNKNDEDFIESALSALKNNFDSVGIEAATVTITLDGGILLDALHEGGNKSITEIKDDGFDTRWRYDTCTLE